MFIFWIVCFVILAIVATVLTEAETFGWATLTFLGVLIAAHFLHLVDLIQLVTTNLLSTCLYAGAYILLGLAWSFIKWFSYLHNVRGQFRESKAQFLKDKGVPIDYNLASDKILLKEFQESLKYSYDWISVRSSLARPRASQNKARITAWMGLWPLSFVGTFLNDPVRRVCNWIFNSFKNLYQKMSDHVFANDPELK